MEEALINFILAHENDDIPKLLLKQKEIFGCPASFVANQINGRRRAKEKLRTWYANPHMVYPPQQNLEQCSSEATAKFKCEIIGQSKKNETIADLTGGFGVDSFFFSQIFSKVFHVEPDAALCQLARKSHGLLGVKNVKYLESTSEEFLHNTNQNFDWLYLDPSRKNNGKKIFRLTDSQPDVIKLLPVLFSKSHNILLKTSPLMDLKEGIKQLPGTKEIYVVSVNNECKEVLFRLENGWTNEPEIVCVNLIHGGAESFRFRFSVEVDVESDFNEPLEFIYEPNASILKAGAFKIIAKTYGLYKIAASTHLYTSHKLKTEFPGRIFQVQSPLPVADRAAGLRPFNIISRNHPLSPEQIKKKFKLKYGGEKYVLAFSGRVKKYILVAERIN